MGLLSMLGLSSKSENIQDFVKKGAVIIDVRTPGEFQGGHIKGSKNIPLNTIGNQVDAIKKPINQLSFVVPVACEVHKPLLLLNQMELRSLMVADGKVWKTNYSLLIK